MLGWFISPTDQQALWGQILSAAILILFTALTTVGGVLDYLANHHVRRLEKHKRLFAGLIAAGLLGQLPSAILSTYFAVRLTISSSHELNYTSSAAQIAESSAANATVDAKVAHSEAIAAASLAREAKSQVRPLPNEIATARAAVRTLTANILSDRQRLNRDEYELGRNEAEQAAWEKVSAPPELNPEAMSMGLKNLPAVPIFVADLGDTNLANALVTALKDGGADARLLVPTHVMAGMRDIKLVFRASGGNDPRNAATQICMTLTNWGAKVSLEPPLFVPNDVRFNHFWDPSVPVNGVIVLVGAPSKVSEFLFEKEAAETGLRVAPLPSRGEHGGCG